MKSLWRDSARVAPAPAAGEPNDWETEIAQLRASMSNFAERHHAAAWAQHPYFGTLPHWAWGVLGYRHIDHHLEQFGV